MVESAVNQVVSTRMVKKQQMRWSPRGAHLLLQVRTRVLNDTLTDDYRRWYPGFTHTDRQDQAAWRPTFCPALRERPTLLEISETGLNPWYAATTRRGRLPAQCTPRRVVRAEDTWSRPRSWAGDCVGRSVCTPVKCVRPPLM